jgi:hypothetical protein
VKGTRKPLTHRRCGYDGKITETVAVPDATTAYKVNDSAPVVGTRTGAFAVSGNPVVVVTPAGPMNAAALELTRTPSLSGTLPIVATRVAVVPTLVCELLNGTSFLLVVFGKHLVEGEFFAFDASGAVEAGDAFVVTVYAAEEARWPSTFGGRAIAATHGHIHHALPFRAGWDRLGPVLPNPGGSETAGHLHHIAADVRRGVVNHPEWGLDFHFDRCGFRRRLRLLDVHSSHRGRFGLLAAVAHKRHRIKSVRQRIFLVAHISFLVRQSLEYHYATGRFEIILIAPGLGVDSDIRVSATHR